VAVVYILTRELGAEVLFEFQRITKERGLVEDSAVEHQTRSRVLGVYSSQAAAQAELELRRELEEGGLEIEEWLVLDEPRGIAPVCSRCGSYHPGPCLATFYDDGLTDENSSGDP